MIQAPNECLRLLPVYRAMYAARVTDTLMMNATRRGELAFHASASGHESMAALASLLGPDDWLHCHYRDTALLIARGVAPRDLFDDSFANARSHSHGRHMPGFHANASLHILPNPVVIASAALPAVGLAMSLQEQGRKGIVYCGIGDGGTQEGEFLEAIAHAGREKAPVLFVVQDNGWAISTSTAGKTFYSCNGVNEERFHGVEINHLDGADALALLEQMEPIVTAMRTRPHARILVVRVERLQSHSNADDQTLYRTELDLASGKTERDPVLVARRRLRQWLNEEQVAALEAEIDGKAHDAYLDAKKASSRAILAAAPGKRPIPVEISRPEFESQTDRKAPALSIREAIRDTLDDLLDKDPRVHLLGQDIEDPKGDVFGVTRGLSTKFGARVRNAPLTEATIVGESIGRALAGQRPIAFIQFADFIGPGFNQITTELASLYWRSGGQYESPVILMVPCGGFRAGLGPFHSATNEAIFAHTPGLDVLMPSTAADAAGLLQAAIRSNRPTIFFYPKGMLNDASRSASISVSDALTPIGCAKVHRSGRDLTLVGWGSTAPVCEQVAATLEEHGFGCDVLDLRSLSPWDQKAVLASVEKTARLVVAHEDVSTCGLGAEVVAHIAEKSRVPVAMRRVARPETWLPFHMESQLELLPTYRRVLETAAELLNLDVHWERLDTEQGAPTIDAVAPSPTDEDVVLIEWRVKVGDRVNVGDHVATLEATKSVFDLMASTGGEVGELLVQSGDRVRVGTPMARLVESNEPTHVLAKESKFRVRLEPRKFENVVPLPRQSKERRSLEVGLSNSYAISGAKVVTSESLANRAGAMSSEDIVKRTGIARRNWVTPEQSAISMAADACRLALDHEGFSIHDMDMLICSTTSPTSVSPSMACRILGQIQGTGIDRGDAFVQAHDISAACSGFLYAIQSAYDFLQSSPEGKVLVVTAEVLSPLVDPNDFDTAILFGDACTATVIYGEDSIERAMAKLSRPVLSARGDETGALKVPLPNEGPIQMQGRKVFVEAVRSMIASLKRACTKEKISVNDLSWIVPHQANQRILDAISGRLDVPVFSNIRDHGNTSSSSIPLCLADMLSSAKPNDRLGLCAFGGGFTFGAGILEKM